MHSCLDIDIDPVQAKTSSKPFFVLLFFFFVLASYSAISSIDPVGIISMGFFFNYRKVQIKFISFN